MATAAAAVWQRLAHTPGNPQLPTLPAPGDPLEGIERAGGYGRLAGIEPVLRRAGLRQGGLAAAPGVARGYAGTYLNQVWLDPAPVNFGAIAAPTTRSVTIHNTYRQTIELQDIDASAVAGLDDISPALPVSIPPFSSLVVVLQAEQTGPIRFDTDITLVFDVRSMDLRVVGQRVIIFDAEPEVGVQEQLVFVTNLMRSKDATEQAFAARVGPRSLTRVAYRPEESLRARLQPLLLGGSPKLQVGRQSWWDARRLTAAVLSASSVLPMDTRYMSIAAGDSLSVLPSAASSLEVTVSTFTDTSVTLAEPVGQDLPLGTVVVPLRFGYLTAPARLGAHPMNLEELALEFVTDDERSIPAIDSTRFPPHPVDGLPIVQANYLTGRTPKRGLVYREVEELDSDTGVRFVSGSEPVGEHSTQVLQYLTSRQAIHEWRQFLHALYGSWGLFYLPTFQQDLPLSAPLSLGGSVFDVPNIGLVNFLGAETPRRDVRVRLDTGEVYYRRVSSIQDNGATERVTLSGVIPGSGTSAVEGTMISWLQLSRIKGDVATFQHQRPGVAYLEFEARTVRT